jgi:hypothetical protein
MLGLRGKHMSVQNHHKEIVKHLRDLVPGHFRVINYGDNSEQRNVMVAEFGNSEAPLFSTVGLCDKPLSIPQKRVELTGLGKNTWHSECACQLCFLA